MENIITKHNVYIIDSMFVVELMTSPPTVSISYETTFKSIDIAKIHRIYK